MSLFPHYYVSSDIQLRDSRNADRLRAAYIEGCGQGFANRFGAAALFTRGFNPSFVGITFQKEPEYPELWTKRTDKIWLQKPKDGIKSVPTHLKQKLVELRKEWLAHWPADAVAPWESATLNLLGLTPETLKEHNLHYHPLDGAVYFATTLPLQGCGLIEILASAYVASAVAKHEKDMAEIDSQVIAENG